MFAQAAGNPAARGWNATTQAVARTHNVIIAALSKPGADITPLLMNLPGEEDLPQKVREILVAPTLAQFSESAFMNQMGR